MFDEAMAMLMDVDRIKAWWVKKSGNGDRWEHALKDWLFGLVQRPVSSLVRTANPDAVGFEDQMLEVEVMSPHLILNQETPVVEQVDYQCPPTLVVGDMV